ncbi:MAG: LamG domain-containing protein [Myxococcota bacterium]
MGRTGTHRHGLAGPRLWIGVTSAVAVALSCQADTFACDDSAQCMAQMGGGQCELNGYCSFPDDECPSGRRYGKLAGGGLAGFCVVGDAPSSTGTTTGDVVMGTTTFEASSSSGLGDTLAVDTGSDTSPGGETGATTGGESSGDSSTGEGLDPDLVLWFEFESIDLDLGITPDSSPAGRVAQCALTTCPVLEPGPVGSAAIFDGVADALEVAHDAAFDIEGELTLAAWARLDMPPVEFSGVVGKSYGTSSANSYEFYYSTSSGNMAFNMDAGANGYAGFSFDMLEGQWVHLAGTFDGTLMRFYVDGQLVDTAVTAGPPAHESVPLVIGADYEGGAVANFWGGGVDDVRLYRRCLDEDEVAALVALGQ